MAVIEGGRQFTGEMPVDKINGREEGIKFGKANIKELRGEVAYCDERLAQLRDQEKIFERKRDQALAQISDLENYVASIDQSNGTGVSGIENGVPKLEPPQETS